MGAHTTNHTTGTIFQSRQPSDDAVATAVHKQSGVSNIIDNVKPDYGSFKIPKQRTLPPSFPEFKDEYKDSGVLLEAVERNIDWVLLGAVGGDCLEKTVSSGRKKWARTSWIMDFINFMKSVTNCSTTKCKLQYLPVVPLVHGTWTW